jgi:hypothetical protein
VDAARPASFVVGGEGAPRRDPLNDAQNTISRREVLKRAAYVTPAIVTLAAVPAFASKGSGEAGKAGRHQQRPIVEPRRP